MNAGVRLSESHPNQPDQNQMKTTLALFLSGIFLAVLPNSYADKPDAMVVFSRLDENGDRKITPKEYYDWRFLREARPRIVSEEFKAADANDDKSISSHEWRRAFPDHDERLGPHKPQRKGKKKR